MIIVHCLSYNNDNVDNNKSLVDSSPVRVQNTKDIKRWASVVSDIDAVQTTDDLETEKTAETTAAITQPPPPPTSSETTTEAPPSSPVPVSAAPAETPAATTTTTTTTSSTGWF